MKQDSGAAMLIDMKTAAPLRYIEQPPTDAEQKSAWEQAIHFIFSDGTALYGLHQYSGKMYVLEGQELVPWHTLPNEQLFITNGDVKMFRGIHDIAWAGGKLYVFAGSDDPEQWDKTALLAFAPATEQLTVCGVEKVQQIKQSCLPLTRPRNNSSAAAWRKCSR